MTVPRRLGVFIYGSCVSRDSFEHLEGSRFQLLEYVARQSLTSAFAPAGAPLLDVAQLTSPFQRRVLELDAASELPARLREQAGAIDLVLWDLFDERLGYYETSAGEIATNSVELIRWQRETGAETDARLVPYGSREHLRTFAQRLVDFSALLDETGLRDRVVLVAPSWATETDTGAPTPSSFGLSARRANVVTLPYLQAVYDVVSPGLVISPPWSVIKAATDHQWGVAPFHYTPDVYRHITAQIDELAGAHSIPAELARRREQQSAGTHVVASIARAISRMVRR